MFPWSERKIHFPINTSIIEFYLRPSWQSSIFLQIYSIIGNRWFARDCYDGELLLRYPSSGSFEIVSRFRQVPFTSAIFIHPSWPWGEFICKASEFFKDLSIGVSVFTLTALSGDRFFAIVDPLRKFHSHSGKRATRITIGIAVLIWILAGVMGIPAMKASHIKVITGR